MFRNVKWIRFSRFSTTSTSKTFSDVTVAFYSVINTESWKQVKKTLIYPFFDVFTFSLTCFFSYLNASVICLLVRSKIDPENYRSVYFIILYMVNEMLEESHHKCHLLAWIRDDPLLPPWVLKDVAEPSDNELIYRVFSQKMSRKWPKTTEKRVKMIKIGLFRPKMT